MVGSTASTDGLAAAASWLDGDGALATLGSASRENTSICIGADRQHTCIVICRNDTRYRTDGQYIRQHAFSISV